MKSKIQFFLFLPLVLFSEVLFSQEKVQLNDSIRHAIKVVLSNPQKVYSLDIQKNTEVFLNIDNWFGKYYNFKNSIQKLHKNGENITYTMICNKNIPLFVMDGTRKDGVKAKVPFRVFYEKELQRRVFVKELNIPSKETLKDETLIEICKSFISKNKFCQLTEMDRLSEPEIVSLKQKSSKADSLKEGAYTLLQCVEFKRRFAGLDVINSKQIVNIHPATSELIAYKNLNWTPVVEASGKNYPYLTFNEVLSRIDSVTGNSKSKSIVSKVKEGMYQSKNYLFPVIEIYIQESADDLKKNMPIQVLIIPLVKDVKFENEKSEKLKPKQIGK